MLSTKNIQEKNHNKDKIKEAMETAGRKAYTEADMGINKVPVEEGSDNYEKKYDTMDYSYLKNSNYDSGPILLSNTELSEEVGKNIKFGFDAYQARGERKYRPNAGVKGLSSEYLSSGQQAFTRKVTVNWTCFTLEDLDVLQERFMTLGRKVYVEWGWASDKLMPTPIFLKETVDKDGNYELNEDVINDKKIFAVDPDTKKEKLVEIKSAAKLLKEQILEKGKGNFDAIIGYVEGFEFSQREDGGFDCTTNLAVNGGNIFKTKPDQPDGDKESSGEKGELSVEALEDTKKGFVSTVQDLPKILEHYLKNSMNLPMQTENIYEDYTTAESFESTTEEKNWAGKMFTGGSWYPWNKESEGGDYKRTTTVKGLSTRQSDYIYNENTIIKRDQVKHWENFEKSGRYAGGEDGVDKQLEKIQKKGGFGKMRGETKIEIAPDECWVRYGWFEDNILNKYFALIEGKENTVSGIRSISDTLIGIPKEVTKTDRTFNRKVATMAAIATLPAGAVMSVTGIGTVAAAGLTTTVYATAGTLGGIKKSYGIHNRVSNTCLNNKAFKTRDINNFIFPGQFDLESKGYDASLLGEQGQTRFESNQSASLARGEEYNFQKDYEEYINELGDNAPDETLDADQLAKELKKFKIGQDDLDMNETGIVPYLELDRLDKVVKEIAGTRPFAVPGGHSENNTKKGSGLIRNIFINVHKLISIFETPAATIEQNIELLSRTLQQETNGMIDLKIELDDEGKAQLKSLAPTPEDDLATIALQEADSPYGIYEFPVHTNDSFVESQEIASDMGSNMVQIMMSKQYASEAIKDKSGNIIAQAIADGIAGNVNLESADGKNEDVIDEPEDDTGTPHTKSLITGMESWKNFGQKDGDEDLPLEKGSGATTEVPPDPDAPPKKTAEGVATAEADAEQSNAIFKSLNTEYTIEGRLKKEFEDTMFTEMDRPTPDKSAIKVTKTDEKGNKTETKYKVVPVTNESFGLLFITNTVSIPGIAGIKPGDAWTTSYLPKKFKNNAHFWTTNVSQTIDSSGWKTTLTGRANMQLKEV